MCYSSCAYKCKTLRIHFISFIVNMLSVLASICLIHHCNCKNNDLFLFVFVSLSHPFTKQLQGFRFKVVERGHKAKGKSHRNRSHLKQPLVQALQCREDLSPTEGLQTVLPRKFQKYQVFLLSTFYNPVLGLFWTRFERRLCLSS